MTERDETTRPLTAESSLKCPDCGGEDVERVSVDIGVGTMHGPIHCERCGYDDRDDGEFGLDCCECDGDGWRVTCIDDMCHGLGYCIHGDGMAMCDCNESCEPPANAPRDWKWTPTKSESGR